MCLALTDDRLIMEDIASALLRDTRPALCAVEEWFVGVGQIEGGLHSLELATTLIPHPRQTARLEASCANDLI